ncbi:MAG: LTA synthase family protein [Clostridia bacterium]|nr:LTA synthase family protein [Clostridia bacterium]
MNFIKDRVMPSVLTLRSKLWVKITSYLLIPLYVFLGLITVEYLNYREFPDLFYMWRSPGKIVCAMIVLSVVTALLLLICKKLWIYATVYGSVMVIIGCINCIKLAVNGDYFFPWDIYMAGNMGDLMSFARFDFPVWFWVLLPIFILFILAFWVAGTDVYLKWYYRLPAATVTVILVIAFYNSPENVSKFLGNFGMSFNDSILQASNYRANGFVNAFTINCFALKVEAPEDYSEQKIADYLAGYEKNEAQESPDVIVILSEAFTDIRELEGTTFSQNPLENYDEISSREGAATGKLYTTALGGGTVRTEFEILTGLTVDYLMNGTSPYLYINNPIESYVSTYKDQGYNTLGLHTYNGKFYMRNVAYPFLGFDKFISEQDIYDMDVEITDRRGYLTDDTFMNVLIDQLEKSTDKPNFVFGITMENHQAYAKTDPSQVIIDVKNEKLSQDILDSVVTYTQGVYTADLSLKKLVDYIDGREKPTVLLFFGDHLPTLGPNQAAYKQAGNVSSGEYDTEDYDFLYSTPYLVYSNYGVDLSVFEDKEISTYYMLSLLADCTKTEKTPYMNYLLDNFESLTKYNVRLQIPIPEDKKDFINSMRLMTYHRIK